MEVTSRRKLKDELKKVENDFSAINTTINLHFTSHTSSPNLIDILSQASNLASKRISMDSLAAIFTVWPDCFVLRAAKSKNGSEVILIDFPQKERDSCVDRRELIQAKIRQWVDQNSSTETIDMIDLNDYIVREIKYSKTQSPNKVSKPQSNADQIKIPSRKSRAEDMKNTNKTFIFRERTNDSIAAGDQGLSLLERIRKKERLIKLKNEHQDPQLKYRTLIESKAPRIYEIIFHHHSVANNGGQGTSYYFEKIISVIRDSLGHPMSKEEIHDVIKYIRDIIGAKKMEIIERNDIRVIRIFKLERMIDLQKLEQRVKIT